MSWESLPSEIVSADVTIAWILVAKVYFSRSALKSGDAHYHLCRCLWDTFPALLDERQGFLNPPPAPVMAVVTVSRDLGKKWLSKLCTQQGDAQDYLFSSNIHESGTCLVLLFSNGPFQDQSGEWLWAGGWPDGSQCPPSSYVFVLRNVSPPTNQTEESPSMLLPPSHSGHTWEIYLKGVSFDFITTNFGPPTFTDDRRHQLD